MALTQQQFAAQNQVAGANANVANTGLLATNISQLLNLEGEQQAFTGQASAAGATQAGIAPQQQAVTTGTQAQIDALNTGTQSQLDALNTGTAAQIAAIRAGQEQETAAYSTAAGIATEAGRIEGMSGDIQRAQAQREVQQQIGTQTATVASNGFANSGSALDLLASSTRQGLINDQLIRTQTALAQAGYEEQAQAANVESAAVNAADNALIASLQSQQGTESATLTSELSAKVTALQAERDAQLAGLGAQAGAAATEQQTASGAAATTGSNVDAMTKAILGYIAGTNATGTPAGALTAAVLGGNPTTASGLPSNVDFSNPATYTTPTTPIGPYNLAAPFGMGNVANLIDSARAGVGGLPVNAGFGMLNQRQQQSMTGTTTNAGTLTAPSLTTSAFI